MRFRVRDLLISNLSEKAAPGAAGVIRDQDCTACTACTDCTGCTGCSACTDCSACTKCSMCTNCSDCSLATCHGCNTCTVCSAYTAGAETGSRMAAGQINMLRTELRQALAEFKEGGVAAKEPSTRQELEQVEQQLGAALEEVRERLKTLGG